MMFKFIKRALMLAILVFGVLIVISAIIANTIDDTAGRTETVATPPSKDNRPQPTRRSKPVQNATDSKRSGRANDRPVTPKLPAYKVVSDEPTDTPGKTQIELRIVVTEKPTETALRVLLQSLFDDARKRRGFKFRSHPNAVYIYAFASRQIPKGPSWIGMLSYNEIAGDTSPNLKVAQSKIVKLYADEPDLQFGLTERQREQAFRELVKAEDQAEHKAAKLYPVPEIGSPGYAEANAKTARRKQRRKFEELHAIYRKRVLRRYKLTEEQAVQISVEAQLRNWPMPAPRTSGP